VLPALRERRDDLPALARHFCDRLGHELGKPITRISPGTLQALEQYDWPGNVRQFENVIQQGVILSRDGILDLADFSGEPLRRSTPIADDEQPGLLSEVQRAHITRVLESTRWRIEGASGAAEILGVCVSTLRNRMKKLGIRHPSHDLAQAV
jgi:DNA-binding NtrC family response regulator